MNPLLSSHLYQVAAATFWPSQREFSQKNDEPLLNSQPLASTSRVAA